MHIKLDKKLYYLFTILLLIELVFTVTSTLASGDKTLVLNSGSSAPLIYNDEDGFYPDIAQKLFNHLNIKIKTIHMPSSRSLKNANQGIDDGIIARTKGINKKYTNLIRVPEEVINLKFVAYSNDKNLIIKKWSDLKDYNIAYIRGWKIFDKNVSSYKTLVKVKNATQLFKLLKNKRTDVVLCQNILSKYVMKQLDYYPYIHKNYLAKKGMFIYLHNRNSNLVPKISSSLKEMKKNGEYQYIYDKHITKIMSQPIKVDINNP